MTDSTANLINQMNIAIAEARGDEFVTLIIEND